MSENCMNHIKNYWENLTTEANELFEQGNYLEAKEIYLNALYRSEVLNNHIESCLKSAIPFIQIYIISCNNLANTYEAIGELDNAEKTLKKPLFYLLYMIGQKVVSVNEIQAELKNAIMNYTQFTKQNGIDNGQEVQLFNSIKDRLRNDKLIA